MSRCCCKICKQPKESVSKFASFLYKKNTPGNKKWLYFCQSNFWWIFSLFYFIYSWRERNLFTINQFNTDWFFTIEAISFIVLWQYSNKTKMALILSIQYSMNFFIYLFHLFMEREKFSLQSINLIRTDFLQLKHEPISFIVLWQYSYETIIIMLKLRKQ